MAYGKSRVSQNLKLDTDRQEVGLYCGLDCRAVVVVVVVVAMRDVHITKCVTRRTLQESIILSKYLSVLMCPARFTSLDMNRYSQNMNLVFFVKKVYT